MKSRIFPVLAYLFISLVASTSQAQISLAGVTEATGGGALAGTSYKNGYLLAIDEVNAAGGVLGQKLVLTQYDIDTNGDAAKAAMQKAVAGKPFVILGPIFSGITLATMPITADTGIPQFTGGEAASLTRKFHPSLLRSSLSQTGSAPRLAALAGFGVGAKKLGLMTIDNEFGRDGRAALVGVFKRRGIEVGFDYPVKPGQKDFVKPVSDLKAANVDAVLLYVNEGEAIDLLKELKKQGFDKPIVSDGLVAAQKVIDGAGPAVEGVLGHMVLSLDAPIPPLKAFSARYQAKYGAKPDQNSLKGFVAIQLIKAVIETAGKIDQPLFLKTIKDVRFDIARFPELMCSISYDYFGDLNRESYFVVIRDGGPKIFATVRSIEGGFVELPSGRQIALNSTEFRHELAVAMKPPSPAKAGAKTR
jgi:branched-chain amino acid transport system substrate-binding protein